MSNVTKLIQFFKLIVISFSFASCLSMKEDIQDNSKTTANQYKDFTFSTNAIPFNSLQYLSVEIDSSDLVEVEIKGSTNKSSVSLSGNQVAQGTTIKHLVNPKDTYVEIFIKYTNGRAITNRFNSETEVIKI